MNKVEWLSVNDYLPPLDHRVLAWDGQEMNIAFIDRIKDDGEPFWTFYDYLEFFDVTHWAELPECPK